jgi:hypothetical protein
MEVKAKDYDAPNKTEDITKQQKKIQRNSNANGFSYLYRV